MCVRGERVGSGGGGGGSREREKGEAVEVVGSMS